MADFPNSKPLSPNGSSSGTPQLDVPPGERAGVSARADDPANDSDQVIGLNGSGPKPPQHVAIIMDGNGRWATERGMQRVAGHRAGAEAVRRTVEACRKLGVRYLTLFSFSTENWGRDPAEVQALMQLFSEHLESEREELQKTGIQLRAVGDLSRLPDGVRSLLTRDITETAENNDLVLTLAVSYGAREEILAACRKIADQVQSGTLSPAEIDSKCFESSLWTAGMPDPDLLIRTSGELRVSNFLLWQIAYAEIVVVKEYWPEFDEALLQRCIGEYQRRERRFGLTPSTQVGARNGNQHANS